MNTLDKIRKARAALIASQPFYAALALRLNFELCDSIETADVDGVTVRFNPSFVDSLSLAELSGVWGHEVMHCASGHIFRQGGRESDQWNRAADYSINPILESAGFTLPKGALSDSKFKDMSAESIYSKLPAKKESGDKGKPGQGAGNGPAQGNKPGQGSDPGKCGGVRPAPSPNGGQASPAEVAKLASDWKIATLQAASMAKAAGMLPGETARAVDRMKANRIDWAEVARRFVSSVIPGDYSWQRPNRRYLPTLYLPSLRPDRIGIVVCSVDMSGSVKQSDLDTYGAEFNAILDEMRPDRVIVLYHDTKSRDSQDLTPSDYPIKLSAKAGGGTDFRPSFDWLESQGITPDCFIGLTDLDAPPDRFPSEPGYPVLWVSTGKESAPFGEVVTLN